MTNQTKQTLLILVASAFMWAGILSKPLHIPQPWDWLPLIAAMTCFFFLFRLQKRMRREKAGTPAPAVPLDARRKVFWMVALALVAGSLGMLPLLPYTVENFQPWIYDWVIPFQVLFVAIFLTFFWRKLMRTRTSRPEAPKSS